MKPCPDANILQISPDAKHIWNENQANEERIKKGMQQVYAALIEEERKKQEIIDAPLRKKCEDAGITLEEYRAAERTFEVEKFYAELRWLGVPEKQIEKWRKL